MALIILADYWAKRRGGKVIGLVVDHGLRLGSDKEAECVKAILNKLGIEVHILCWSGDKPKSNIQALAREARYRLLTDWCKENRLFNLLLGHTKDDQAETIYSRLRRGSGVDGLSAMSAVTSVKYVRVLRPLLGIERVHIQDYLVKLGIDWINDPSNENEKFERVKIRKFLNHDKLFKKRLADTAAHMGRVRTLLENFTMQLILDCIAVDAIGYATIDLIRFKNYTEEEQLRAVARVLSVIGGKNYKPRLRSLSRLLAFMVDADFRGVITLHSCKVIIKCGVVLILRERSKSSLNIPLSETLYWDGRFTIEADIINIHNIAKGVVYVDYLTESEWGKVRSKVGKTNILSSIIYTLPALKLGNKVVAIPQLKFYDIPIKKYVRISFKPRQSLSMMNFNYVVNSS